MLVDRGLQAAAVRLDDGPADGQPHAQTARLGRDEGIEDLTHELRVEAYSHVQELDLGFFEETSTASLMAILNDDINQLERFLDSGANDLLQVGTTVVANGTIFIILDPTIA